MPFFTFNQNNSGGSFELTDALTRFVVVETESADDANERLENLGGYFDGCSSGMDCECCGDRWSPVDQSDARDAPSIYGEHPAQYRPIGGKGWMPEGKEIVVHYADGRKEWF